MSNGHQRILGICSSILEPFVYVFSGFGILAYIIHYIISLAEHEQPVVSPIGLAAVTATLGGLILVGAFYKEDQTDLGRSLKSSAKALLGSSVFFITAFLLLEAALYITEPVPQWLITLFAVFSDIVIALAGVTLAFALGRLVRILPLI